MLLNNGNHPFYEETDDTKSYMKKLKNPEWHFSENFTEYIIINIKII